MPWKTTHHDEKMNSKVALRTHRFWEALAIPAGIILVIHAVLSFVFLPLSTFFLFLSLIEFVVGLTIIIVDVWFLLHV
jgi:uncharacterized RDD family membrane protein YckC